MGRSEYRYEQRFKESKVDNSELALSSYKCKASRLRIERSKHQSIEPALLSRKTPVAGDRVFMEVVR